MRIPPGQARWWVAPFGDPGITDRSHLPRAFRSVPRPSSPLSAKASTRCPYLALDRRRLLEKKTPHHRPRTGPKPCSPRQRGAGPRKSGAHKRRRPHMKTLLRTRPVQALLAPSRQAKLCLAERAHNIAAARRIRLGHITTLSLHPSISIPAPRTSPRNGVFLTSPNAAGGGAPTCAA